MRRVVVIVLVVISTDAFQSDFVLRQMWQQKEQQIQRQWKAVAAAV